MNENEIEKYRAWFAVEETTKRLMNLINEQNEGAEIKGIDDFKNLLDESIKHLTQKIEELSDNIEADIAHQIIYNTVLNKFLYLIALELLHISTSLKRNEFAYSPYIRYEGNNKFRLDNYMIKYWLKGELALPYHFIGHTKSINSKWLKNWFKYIDKTKFTKSYNSEMLKPIEQIDEPEKRELIDKIKTSRDILIKEKNKNPYALTQICKKVSERYGIIPYNTLRDKMKRFNIPVNINKFTKIYG